MPTRSFRVARGDAGRPLLALLRARLGLSAEAARGLVRARRVRLAGAPCLDPNRRLLLGQRVEVQVDAPPKTERSPLPRSVLRHVDDEIVVVDKPPGLTTMRH